VKPAGGIAMWKTCCCATCFKRDGRRGKRFWKRVSAKLGRRMGKESVRQEATP
jgi:hypothetical protein